MKLCRGVLKKDFHHGPTRGGKAESNRYHNQYHETLQGYVDQFGVAPPSDIWPTVEDRFKNADQFVRINHAGYWLLPKPPRYLTALLISPVFLAACTQGEDGYDFWFYVKVAFGIYIVYKILQWLYRHGGGKGSGGGCGSGCSGCGGCGG